MEQTPQILVVDDDHELRKLLGTYLQRQGLGAATVADGRAMWAHLDHHSVDLLILDLMLPGDDGLELCRQLRATSQIPIIMLTARGDPTDRIVGLELGADDYVTKPFEPRELLARIKVVLRRTGGGIHARSGLLRFAGWVLDTRGRMLTDPDGSAVALTDGEYRLLEAFVERPNRVLSRDHLLSLLQGREALPFDRAIDIQVSRLRRRLHDPAETPELIKTVRGAGYLFAAHVERVPG